MEFRQAPFRAFLNFIFSSNILFATSCGFLVALISGGTNMLTNGWFYLTAGIVIVVFLTMWIVIFNRNPKLPYYRLKLQEECLIVDSLASSKKVSWKAIGSISISFFRYKLLIKDTQGKALAEIFLYGFNNVQRTELMKQLSSHHNNAP